MVFLPDLLASIAKQSRTDFTVLIIDNGSTDGVESFLKEKFPSVRYLRNARNLGFSGAHNQGIRYALEHWGKEFLNNKFILVTNPDVILTPTYLEEIVSAAEKNPSVGAFGGKLLRAYDDGLHDEVLKEIVRSNRIDSTGLRMRKGFIFTDRGAGEMDSGQYDESGEVFGISGALVLYRAKALQDTRDQDEFFDQDFFAYKEDVDLAMRMQYAGWLAWYEPQAVAYHYRGMYGPERMGFFARIANRQKKSRSRNYLSVRNHWLLLIKNVDLISFLFSFPRILVSECLRVFYVLLFEISNARAILDVIRLLPRMWKKRRMIQSTKLISGNKIRKRFVE